MSRHMILDQEDFQAIHDYVPTCASYLEEVVFFKLFENAPLDFNKLIGYQKRQESVVVGINSDIEGNKLVDHD